MVKRNKPDAPRRVWRITAETPLGVYVDPALEPERPAALPIVDEAREANWLRSSWDLLNGLEVSESGPGDFDELFRAPQKVPAKSAVAAATREAPARAANASLDMDQWVLRFALKLAEVDRHADPREVISLAKGWWQTHPDLSPEEAANTAHVLKLPARQRG